MNFLANMFAQKPAAFESWDASQVYQAHQQQNPQQVFLDVREPAECLDGVIPGSLNISLGQLAGKLTQLDKDKHYILICRSGNRSQMAARLMAKAGFQQLVNFHGGMLAWQQQNYPTA